MSNINRTALLKAAEGLLSSSSNESSDDQSDVTRSPAKKRHRSERRSKHNSKKQKKHKEKHRRHRKRSEQDKIQELERKAVAIGATSSLSRLPGGLGGFSTAAGTAAADAILLDTVGDANNAVFESLYASSVPRYHRIDPLNLVSSARYNWQAQLLGDKDAGNSRANRYYKGRNLLLERSRQTRRIYMPELRPKSRATAELQQQQQALVPINSSINSSSWMSILAALPQQLTAIGFGPGVPAPQPTVDHAAAPPASTAAPGTASTAGLHFNSVQATETGTSADGANRSSSRRLVVPAPAFIPLELPEELVKAATDDSNEIHDGYRAIGGAAPAKKIDPELLVQQAGLTPDDWVLKATRAWNIAVRERPQEEQLWLDFAAFQHTAARLLQQRGRFEAADVATAEKQVAVLTRGLTHHPNSQALLLALLRSYAVIAPDAAALDDKWKGVLARQPGSWTLWREYLIIKNASFAAFSISSLQHSYQEALHSLHMELLAVRRKAAAAHKQQHGASPPQLTPQQLQQMSLAAAAAAESGSSSGGLAALLPVCVREEELELQMVQILLGLLYHELVSGHTELALAKIQAVLEYQLFQPPTPPGGAAALLRLFAAFWESGAARIGDKGARGWAYWCCWHAMGMEQPTAAAAAAEDEDAQQQQQQEEPTGWTGWFEVPQQQQQQQQQQGDNKQEAAGQEQSSRHKEPQRVQKPGSSKSRRKRHRRSSDDGVGGSQKSGSDASGSDSDVSQDDGSQQDEEEGEVDDDQADEDAAAAEEEEEEELDEVDLMLQLGIQLEEQLQEVEKQGLPPHIVKRWVSEEANRCSTQWQPLHPNQQQQQSAKADAEAPDEARIIHFDAVAQCIFPIRSMSALRRLILGTVELLGASLGSWCSTNCPTPLQQLSPGVPDDGTGVTSGPRTAGSPGMTPSGTWGESKPQWSDATADGAAGPEVTAAVAGPAAGAEAIRRQQQQQQLPWYQGSNERWGLLVTLLDRLVTGGPCNSWPELCSAMLLLHADKPVDTVPPAAAASSNAAEAGGSNLSIPLTIDGAAAVSGSSSSNMNSTWPSQQQIAAMRAAAKQLLSDQRDNLSLYDAYGCCEVAMGQIKTGQKVLGSALALATGTAASSSSSATGSDTAAAAAAVPVLALHLAQLEFAGGGTGGLERAHAAVHACLAGDIFQPAAGQAQKAAAQLDGQQQQQQQQGLLADSAVLKARRGFQDRIHLLLRSNGGSLDLAAACTVAAAALYELALGILTGRPGKGLAAAAAVYKQVLAAVPESVRLASQYHEQLQVLYCHMLVAAATGAAGQLVPAPAAAAAAVNSSSGSGVSAAVATALMAAVSPARARSALASALLLYPSSKALLNLQMWLDHSCYTLAGLKRQLAALSELNPSPSLWGAALRAEGLRPGGQVRLRALYERALAAPTPIQRQQQQHVQQQQRLQALAAAGFRQQQQQGRNAGESQELEQQQLLQGCTAASRSAVLLDLAVQDGYRGWGSCSALWEQYIQYELSLGRQESARKLFLRAVHECPGFKGLWLLGFGALCEGMQPREASGLMTAMQEREVVVRTDVYEVLLADMAEKQQ